MYSSELCMLWHGGNSPLTNGARVFLGFIHLMYKWMAAVQVVCKRRVRTCQSSVRSSEASEASHPETGRELTNESYLQ